jgi:hypothetical protein
VSASSGSDRNRIVRRGGRRGWRAPLASLLALGVLAALLAAPAVAGSVRGRSESAQDTPVVRRVRIGPAAIQVEDYGRAGGERAREIRREVKDRVRAHVHDMIRVGPRGVTVVSGDSGEVSDENEDVRDHGIIVATGDAGLVRVFADARVPAGEVVQGDVVAVFGSVDVEGTVAGDAVAVFGSVRLHPGARVEGDAVAIGGVLDHPTGAQVSGQSVALGFFLPGWGPPSLAVLLGVVLMGWLATLFVGWLLALLFPERMKRIGATASRHTAGSLFLGLLSAPLFVIALVLLVITLVGIPFAFLLVILYPFAIWAGQIAALSVLGSKILRRKPGEGGLVAPIGAGSLLVGLLFVAGAVCAIPEGPVRTLSLFFTLFGVLLLLGLSIIGTGALILSRVGSRSAEPALPVVGTTSAPLPASP